MFARRLVVTVAAVLALLAADRVPLPEIDARALPAGTQVGAFGLGLMPLLVAFAIVELAAILVPRWSRLRHAGPKSRAKLTRAAYVLMLVLAIAQAIGVVLSIGATDAMPHPGIASGLVVGATLVAGTCVLAIAAQAVTRHGLANGLVLFVATSYARLIVDEAVGQHALVRSWPLMAVAIAVPLVATWIGVAAASHAEPAPAASAASAYRDARSSRSLAPWIPIPASSIYASTLASSLSMSPALFALLGVSGAATVQGWFSRDRVVFRLGFGALVLALGVVLSFLFHRKRDVAALLVRLGAPSQRDAEKTAAAEVRRAIPATLLFLAALQLASEIGLRLHGGRAGPVALAIVAAAVRDLVVFGQHAARRSDLVCVHEERRPYAIAALRSVLAAEIPTFDRGLGIQTMLQAFAPYAPVEIWVPAADAKRAHHRLRELLRGESPPRREEPAKELPAEIRPWSSPQRAAALAIVAGVAAVGAGASAILPERPSAATVAPRAKLEIVRVDDVSDPFEAVSDDDRLPLGVAVYGENVPGGVDAAGNRRLVRVRYARAAMQPGDTTPEQAWARMQPWLATIALPPGARLAPQRVDDFDQDTGASTPQGMRTLLLTGAPIVTTDDVVDAVAARQEEPRQRYYVAVTLSREGAARFERATAEWVGRRIAIVLDGEVDSAPVVMSKIGGGHVSIDMGSLPIAEQRAAAERLARGLGGR